MTKREAAECGGIMASQMAGVGTYCALTLLGASWPLAAFVATGATLCMMAATWVLTTPEATR